MVAELQSYIGRRGRPSFVKSTSEGGQKPGVVGRTFVATVGAYNVTFSKCDMLQSGFSCGFR
jgi:hypothetical protein